jgi:hypothetical protein
MLNVGIREQEIGASWETNNAVLGLGRKKEVKVKRKWKRNVKRTHMPRVMDAFSSLQSHCEAHETDTRGITPRLRRRLAVARSCPEQFERRE